MSDVTRILTAIEDGDAEAANKLLPIVYHELRSLAAQRLSNERPGQTLQPTALVHEAYIRLLALVSETLKDPSLRDKILAAETPEEIYSLLIGEKLP